MHFLRKQQGIQIMAKDEQNTNRAAMA